MKSTHITLNEDETTKLGYEFAQELQPGDVVALYGDLGAGKTELVKGICDFFGVTEVVSSPTFSIINQYVAHSKKAEGVKIYHIDLYRVESAEEIREIGLDECTHTPDAIKLIEWAEKATSCLPQNTFSVHFMFDDDDDDKRIIEIIHEVHAEVH
jgi:tRNA threonylcarbamoyladenosine biosynthesis protein TsaE